MKQIPKVFHIGAFKSLILLLFLIANIYYSHWELFSGWQLFYLYCRHWKCLWIYIFQVWPLLHDCLLWLYESLCPWLERGKSKVLICTLDILCRIRLKLHSTELWEKSPPCWASSSFLSFICYCFTLLVSHLHIYSFFKMYFWRICPKLTSYNTQSNGNAIPNRIDIVLLFKQLVPNTE